MLIFDQYLPDNARDGLPVLLLLHGRGSHRGDLQALRPHIPPGWGLVTPQAPHPGHPWGYGPGWAWYQYLTEDQVDPTSLEKGLDELTRFMDNLPAQLASSRAAWFSGASHRAPPPAWPGCSRTPGG